MTQVKERPILFSAAMVRAILADEKMQARPKIKPQPVGSFGLFDPAHGFRFHEGPNLWCPYGKPGDRLWVRETFGYFIDTDTINGQRVELGRDFVYRADDENKTVHTKWTPSIHMPRKASRITLEINGVRVERLNDISEQDAEAEGVAFMREIPDADETLCASKLFELLWESINGAGSWEQNPWVWVIEFKRV